MIKKGLLMLTTIFILCVLFFLKLNYDIFFMGVILSLFIYYIIRDNEKYTSLINILNKIENDKSVCKAILNLEKNICNKMDAYHNLEMKEYEKFIKQVKCFNDVNKNQQEEFIIMLKGFSDSLCKIMKEKIDNISNLNQKLGLALSEIKECVKVSNNNNQEYLNRIDILFSNFFDLSIKSQNKFNKSSKDLVNSLKLNYQDMIEDLEDELKGTVKQMKKEISCMLKEFIGIEEKMLVRNSEQIELMKQIQKEIMSLNNVEIKIMEKVLLNV